MNSLLHKNNTAAKPAMLHGNATPFVQAKLTVNTPGDQYEQEADAMADRVMRMSSYETAKPVTGLIGKSLQRKCVHCEEEEKKKKPIMRKAATGNSGMAVSPSFAASLNASRGGGSSLPKATRSFMENAFSADFSGVRVHHDSQAYEMSKGINAKAFTHGNDIYFSSGEYQPNTERGKHLLAHELTHTVQQGSGESSISQKVQLTEVGDILDEFFSASSTEHLWNMGSTDNYTTRVIAWQPVIDGLTLIKNDIRSNCSTWAGSHRTDSSWVPVVSFSPDPNSFRHLVAHPPGTEPSTCAGAFIIYNSLRGVIFESRGPQTDALYTCSIGSFNLLVTVDSINCTSNNAVLNIWMYNNMSRGSFGRFARYFPLSGMQNQHMWWHWNESITWPAPATVPALVSAPTPIPGPVNGLVTASRLNIRATPNTSSPITGSYPRNTAISVICQTTGSLVNGTNVWYQTDRGFVSAQYLLLAGAAVPGTC